MVNNFDRAVLNKIKKVWPNTIYSNLAVTYHNVYDSLGDPTSKLELPLINIHRPTGYRLDERQTVTARLLGLPINKYLKDNDEFVLDNEGNKVIDTSSSYMARYLIANLDYQIDIYATSTEMLDEISHDIIHMLSLDPFVKVKQKDRSRSYVYEEEYEMGYSQGPSDESEFSDGQRLYRYALAYEIKTARLINFKELTTVDGIVIKLDLEDDENSHTIVEKEL